MSRIRPRFSHPWWVLLTIHISYLHWIGSHKGRRSEEVADLPLFLFVRCLVGLATQIRRHHRRHPLPIRYSMNLIQSPRMMVNTTIHPQLLQKCVKLKSKVTLNFLKNLQLFTMMSEIPLQMLKQKTSDIVNVTQRLSRNLHAWTVDIQR